MHIDPRKSAVVENSRADSTLPWIPHYLGSHTYSFRKSSIFAKKVNIHVLPSVNCGYQGNIICNCNMTDEVVDFHPVELAAHFVLSGSLDTLHESFSSLHESQKILLTRLHLIETRLTAVSEILDLSHVDMAGLHARIKQVRKKLQECAATVKKVEAKVSALED